PCGACGRSDTRTSWYTRVSMTLAFSPSDSHGGVTAGSTPRRDGCHGGVGRRGQIMDERAGLDQAIADPNDALGMRGHLGIVCHENDGDVLFRVELLKHPQDFHA